MKVTVSNMGEGELTVLLFTSIFVLPYVLVKILKGEFLPSGRSFPRNRQSSGQGRQTKGYVYVLTNPVLSDAVKIGYTTRSAEKRARELSGTGVPGEWKVAYEITTSRPKQVEKKVHRKLSHRRFRDGGEFFKVDPEEAARVIKKVRG